MKRNVLIVDDSPEDREMVTRALRRDSYCRYTISEVQTGAEGLEMLRKHSDSFDLVFLDYHLSDMNADQFVAKLTGSVDVPDVPIIVLTGSTSNWEVAGGPLQHGIQDFFTKAEITPAVMARIASNAIERHRLLRRLVVSEQAAEAARQAAEQANRGKSQFIALISHELRTPLTAILGFADILRDNPNCVDAAEIVKMITESGQHLHELLNDLIDIAKVEAGTLDIEPRPFNPRALITTTCQLLAIRAGDKGLSLKFEIDPSLPSVVRSDPIRLRQILINLLGNAIKFTAGGEIRCVAKWDAEEDRLTARVSDTGPGIPTDKIAHIFDPFVQGEASGASRREGIGLGLAISRRLAEMMGGGVSIESTGPTGTTFVFSIQSPPTTQNSVVNPTPGADVNGVPNLGGRKLLVAEDTRAIQMLLRRLLNDTGASVEIVDNGLQAIQRLEGKAKPPYDLIIMDMMMPVMDGFDATREIRARGLTVPVLALTAAAHEEDEHRCYDAGCDNVLTKPLDVIALYGTLCQLLT
ncbi:MAG: response regulator [Planctomycetales bacterium]|nr:response regulator [Planctomycetales bacterium]